ncbi:MAG TPA: preprotein translocase subunit SecG [Gammaproteobacteria bacterium]
MLVIHVLIAISLVGLVLIQHGKGADMGAAFGSGASSTVFGSRGAGSFLTRVTAILAALFFVTNLGLAFLATQSNVVRIESVVDRVEAPAAPASPAAPSAASDLPAVPPKQPQ